MNWSMAHRRSDCRGCEFRMCIGYQYFPFVFLVQNYVFNSEICMSRKPVSLLHSREEYKTKLHSLQLLTQYIISAKHNVAYRPCKKWQWTRNWGLLSFPLFRVRIGDGRHVLMLWIRLQALTGFRRRVCVHVHGPRRLRYGGAMGIEC